MDWKDWLLVSNTLLLIAASLNLFVVKSDLREIRRALADSIEGEK